MTVNSQDLVYVSHGKAAQESPKAFAFYGTAVTVNSVELVYVSHGKAAQESPKAFAFHGTAVPAEQSRSCVRKSRKSCAGKPSKAFAFHGTAVAVNILELVYVSHGKAAQQIRLRLLPFMEQL